MKQVDVLYFYVPKSLIFNGLQLKTFKTDLELYETRIPPTISSEFNLFVSAGLIITGYHIQAEHFFKNYGLIHALNEWLEGKNIKFTRPVISNKSSFYGFDTQTKYYPHHPLPLYKAGLVAIFL